MYKLILTRQAVKDAHKLEQAGIRAKTVSLLQVIWIHVNEIKNIERVRFPEFYADFDKNLTNRKLDGIYSYVITSEIGVLIENCPFGPKNILHIACSPCPFFHIFMLFLRSGGNIGQ